MTLFRGYGRPAVVTAAEIAANKITFGTTVLSCVQFFNPYTVPGYRFLLRKIIYTCQGGITFGRITHGRPGGGSSTLLGGGAIESTAAAADGKFPWAAFGGLSGSNAVNLDYGVGFATNENIPLAGGSPSVPSIVVRKYAYSSNAYPEYAQMFNTELDFMEINGTLPGGYIVSLRPGFSLVVRSRAEDAPMTITAMWDIEDYGTAYGNLETGDP